MSDAAWALIVEDGTASVGRVWANRSARVLATSAQICSPFELATTHVGPASVCGPSVTHHRPSVRIRPLHAKPLVRRGMGRTLETLVPNSVTNRWSGSAMDSGGPEVALPLVFRSASVGCTLTLRRASESAPRQTPQYVPDLRGREQQRRQHQAGADKCSVHGLAGGSQDPTHTSTAHRTTAQGGHGDREKHLQLRHRGIQV